MKKFFITGLYFILALLVITAIGFGIYIAVSIAWTLIKFYLLMVLAIIILIALICNS